MEPLCKFIEIGPSVHPSVRLSVHIQFHAAPNRNAELHLTYFGGKEYIYLRPPTTYDSLRYDGLRRVDIVASTRSPEQTVPPILTTIRIPAPDWAQPPIGLSSSIKDYEFSRLSGRRPGGLDFSFSFDFLLFVGRYDSGECASPPPFHI